MKPQFTSDITILCPFTVVVDTREQNPWVFEGLTQRYQGIEYSLQVKTVRKGLTSGDYSIEGLENTIAIERKSIADLVSTIAHNRERFVSELERLNSFTYSAVIVEGEWKSVLEYCYTNSGYNPTSLDNSIHAWMQRYHIPHWIFRPTRATAVKTAYKVLDRFNRELQKGPQHDDKYRSLG